MISRSEGVPTFRDLAVDVLRLRDEQGIRRTLVAELDAMAFALEALS